MIYLITNKIDGKRYIGKTSRTVEQRWYQHCKNAEYGHDTYLYRAIRKHGASNFIVEQIGEGLDEEEVLCIETYQPEYNMTAGGTGGDTSKSPNYIAAMLTRDTSGHNNSNYGKYGTNSPNYGKTRTEEQKQRAREGYKGKRVAVLINDIHYESVSRAAKLLGRSERYVRLHDKLNTWTY
jgi:group I intron endonuclease